MSSLCKKCKLFHTHLLYIFFFHNAGEQQASKCFSKSFMCTLYTKYTIVIYTTNENSDTLISSEDKFVSSYTDDKHMHVVLQDLTRFFVEFQIGTQHKCDRHFMAAHHPSLSLSLSRPPPLCHSLSFSSTFPPPHCLYVSLPSSKPIISPLKSRMTRVIASNDRVLMKKTTRDAVCEPVYVSACQAAGPRQEQIIFSVRPACYTL